MEVQLPRRAMNFIDIESWAEAKMVGLAATQPGAEAVCHSRGGQEDHGTVED
jgi:hypothetical protein